MCLLVHQTTDLALFLLLLRMQPTPLVDLDVGDKLEEEIHREEKRGRRQYCR